MSLKLCFKDKIHRISQAPADFKALTGVIIATYPNQLPPSWELYYIDSEGDKISLSHEQDYKDFLGSNPNNPSMSFKVYIVPADGEPLNPPVAPLHVAQVVQEPRQQEEEKIEEQKIEEVPQKVEEKQEQHSEEDAESRESSEELSDEISQQSDDIRQLTDSNITSQNKREKAVKAERNSREERQPKKEVKPRADPRPGNEGGNNRALNQAKELLKRITRGDMSDAELMQALEKMDKLEESMSPEQKEELRKKKEDIERRRARRESRMANGPGNEEECKGEGNVENSQVSRGKRGNHRGSRREERKAEEKPEPMKGSRRSEKLARPNKEDLRKEREKRTRANKVLRNLDRILAAVEKGDRKTVSKCRERALEDLAEEEKKILEPVFEILAKGGNADTLRNAIKEAEGKLLGGSDQQEMDDSDEKEEKLKNYSQEVREKALQMKEAFPNEDIDKLCEYVAESPEEMSLGELLSVYKP